MEDIKQAIAAYNTQRENLYAEQSKAHRKTNLIFGGILAVMAALALLLFSSGRIGGGVALLFGGGFILLIAFFIMRGSAEGPGIALQAEIRERVFPAVFPEIENLRFRADTKGFYDEIPEGLRPGGDRAGFGDLIEGDYQGQPVVINEMSTTRRTERDDRTENVVVFKGIAIKFGLSQPVPDLIVSPNRLAVAKWVSDALGTGPDLPHVAFDDEAFESTFDIHSSDEPFARAVFSDEGRARYLALQSAQGAGTLRLGATGETAYLLVEHDKNLFELPPLDRPFDEHGDAERLRGEMTGLLALIDGTRALLEAGAAEQLKLT